MVVVFYYSGLDLGHDVSNLPEFEFMNVPTELSEFQQFALITIFAYDMMPTIAQQFSISAISTQLLQTGFDPILLTVIVSFALLAGQMILYLVGVIFKKLHHGVSKKGFGGAIFGNKFFHKYHFLIYLIVPFTGILGDAVMLYSGFARINPIRIIPFLYISNLASSARWIFPAMAQLEISKLFGA